MVIKHQIYDNLLRYTLFTLLNVHLHNTLNNRPLFCVITPKN